VTIANLNDGSGGTYGHDVDGLTFIETNNLTSTDDVLIGSVRTGGDDTIVTIDPGTGLTGPQWPIIAPPELVDTPDDDGITNITADDVDDIAWDPASDQIYAVLGGSSLNYLGRLVWVLDDGAGGTTTSATIPRGGGGAPDFSSVLRLDFIRLGVPAVNDVEGLGFSNVGATFGTFFGMVGDGGTNDDELLVFDKSNGSSTSLIDVRNDATQGTGNQDYEAIDCVQPVLPAQLTIGELATPDDGTQFTFDGGLYGAIGPGDTNDGLTDGDTESKTVSAGTYVITQDPDAGWSLDDITCTGDLGFDTGDWSIDLVSRELTVTVAEGQSVSCDFENSRLDATVGDRVWLDTDGDGTQDPGENGINGVTMTLRDSSGGVVATQDTTGDGDYDFTGVTPGTYTVTADVNDLPPGVVATYDLDGTGTVHVATVVVSAGDDIDTVDFGYVPNDLTVAKTVYRGHDSGAGCPGGESVIGVNTEAVTYCFVVTNTGDAPLTGVTLDDADLGIDESDMTVLSGSLATLAPGASVSLSYDGSIAGDLLNTVSATGTTGSGAVLTAQDTASVDEIA
ncbi:MAG: SdrD B-like domain-containing protein, partial [Actinomycetota bacterium]